MAEAKKKGLISHGVAAQNRKARFDYTIKETIEAGLVLKGAEVKSLRLGRATLTEAWAGERDGEMWLFNAYIPEYQGGVLSRFEPRAPRKLLLKRKQIGTLLGAVAREGATLVPLRDPFQRPRPGEGAAGRRPRAARRHDKRAAVAARDWQRDKARLMRNRGGRCPVTIRSRPTTRIAKTGAVKDKLIEKKQDWAREGRLLTGTHADPARERLPPGQRLVKDWPVLDLGVQPDVHAAEVPPRHRRRGGDAGSA